MITENDFHNLLGSINQDGFYDIYQISMEGLMHNMQYLQTVHGVDRPETLMLHHLVMCINQSISNRYYWANAALSVTDQWPWVTMRVSNKNAVMHMGGAPLSCDGDGVAPSLHEANMHIRKAFQTLDRLHANCAQINQMVVQGQDRLQPFQFQQLNPRDVVNNPYFYSLNYLNGQQPPWALLRVLSESCKKTTSSHMLSMHGDEMVLMQGYDPVQSVMLADFTHLRGVGLTSDQNRVAECVDVWLDLAAQLTKSTLRKFTLR